MARKRKKTTKRIMRKRRRPKRKRPIKKALKKAETNGIKKIKIRVIGIGGGGSSVVSEIAQSVKGASFFAANSDLRALGGLSRKVSKFYFGQTLTGGLGTGMNSGLGEEAAMTEKERIKKLLQGQDLVILIVCLGGGLGSGAAPVFAKISKNLGNLTYGIFTLPFKFEGEKKMEIAKNSLKELQRNLNTFSIIPNERIFKIIDKSAPLKKALSAINKSLSESLQSLIEIIYQPGLINIDFADLRTIFEGRGKLTYLNSIEAGKEEDEEVIERVINSPLYPYGINGAKGVLINISGQKDLSLTQVSQISKVISDKVYRGAKIIFGISKAKKASKMKVTLLATGCAKKIFPEKTKKHLKKKPTPKPEPKKPVKPPAKVKKKKVKVKVRKIKIKSSSPKKQSSLKGSTSTAIKAKKSEVRVRKSAVQVKKEIEEEEAEIISREKFWETPAFQRKKMPQG